MLIVAMLSFIMPDVNMLRGKFWQRWEVITFNLSFLYGMDERKENTAKITKCQVSIAAIGKKLTALYFLCLFHTQTKNNILTVMSMRSTLLKAKYFISSSKH
jgi:hypothetical protein